MVNRFAFAAVAVALATGVAAGVAVADEPAKAEADAFVRKGMELGRAGKLDQAIAEFKRAESIYPRAVSDCNIGLAYARQSKWPQAHFFLVRCRERWSREETRPMDAWVDQRIKKSLGALKSGPFAPVQVRVTPADASIGLSAFAPDETFVGGRIVWLPHGSAIVTATREGYATREVAIDVSGSATQTVPIELARIPEPTVEPTLEPTPPLASPTTRTEPGIEPGAGAGAQVVPPPVDARPAGKSHGAAWVLVGAGTALGVAGGVVHVISADTRSELIALQEPDSGASSDDKEAKRDTFLQQRNAALGLYAAGGVALGVGIYLLLRSDGSKAERSSGAKLGAAPTRGGGAVWLQWDL